MSRVFIVALLACSMACGSKKDDPTKSNLAAFQSGEPVKFETLQGFLPDDGYLTREGWHKSDLTGMALTVPIRGAQASVTLRKDNAEVVVDIIDTVFNQSLYAPVAAFLAEGFEAKDAKGYKRSITIQNQPAFEEWTSADRTAGLTVLVGKRYLVHLQATGLPSTDGVKAIASQINMAKLADLK